MNSRPVDIVFDSTTARDRDNPRFTLSPILSNVVGYSVIWANVTFSYFTIDRLNNEFMLYMEDDLRAFRDLPDVYSILTAKPNARIYYRIFCRINPGTYNPITLAHELKRVFGTEPIVEAVRYDPDYGFGEDILPALLAALPEGMEGLAAPNSSKFAIEVDPKTNRLQIWNTVHTRPFSISIPNSDLAYILGFKPTAVDVLPDSVFPNVYNLEGNGSTYEFTVIPSGQTALTFSIPSSNTYEPGALIVALNEAFTGSGYSLNNGSMTSSGNQFALGGSTPEWWLSLGFNAEQATLQTFTKSYTVKRMESAVEFPGKMSTMDQEWRNGGIIKDARDTLFLFETSGNNIFVQISCPNETDVEFTISRGVYTTLDALITELDTKIQEDNQNLKLELTDGKLRLYHTNELAEEGTGEDFQVLEPYDVWQFLGFDSDTLSAESADKRAANFPSVYEPEEPLRVQMLYSDHLANLTYSPMLNIHSSFANSSLGSARYVASSESLLIQVPVLSNFGSYIQYQPTNSETQLTRQTISNVDLHVTLGQRRKYARNAYNFDTEDFERVDFLPLNNEGFQLCIRFFIDDGIVPKQ